MITSASEPPTQEQVVRGSFERQVDLFTGDDSPFARQPQSPVPWMGALAGDMIVLDVACGAAHATEQAAPYVRQVVGIDLTPALLTLGAARLHAAGIANVLLEVGDAAELPYVDGSFDVVICRSALHHFPRPAAPVAEMARVCRADGRVVISDMVATSTDVRDAFDAVHRRLDPSHAAVLTGPEMTDLAASTVGPVTYECTNEPASLPVDGIFTDVSDRDSVLAALHAELEGGPATGFHPVVDDGRLLVSFTSTVVHATPR